MSNQLPPTAYAAKPDISELISEIVDGKRSLFDFIRSPQDGDYRAHVEMMRTVSAIATDLRALKALGRELNEKIANYTGNSGDSEQIEEQLFRKDGQRRFEKLMVQQSEAFGGKPSLLSGPDFDTCLTQYKGLLSHVEKLWASAAQEYKLNNFPIAAFLSILVVEEIGKLGRLSHDLVNFDAPRGTPSDHSVDRDHRRKHFIGVISGALINSRLDRILGKDAVKKLLHEAESDEFEKTRQACLYIDMKDGVPVTPAEQISENRARTLVVLAGELMAEVLGHFPWEFERMLGAVMTFEEELGISPKKVAR